jgi:hypothetical protein
MKYLLGLILLLVVTAPAAKADIPKPPQPPQRGKVVMTTRLEVVPETNAFQARLQISESDLKTLRAALDGAPGSPAVVAGVSASPGRTIIAGMMLFLAISFAGVWLARSRSAAPLGRAQKTIATLILIAGVAGAATIIARANAGPPPGYWTWRNLSKNLAENRPTAGSLAIEVVPDDPLKPRMTLVIPVEDKKKSGDE